MNEVTGPIRPWGSIFSAAATVAALAVLLVFASVASGASAPITGGTTTLTLKKGFKQKLSSNEIKLLKSGSGKVGNGTVQLSVTGGEIDSSAKQGSIQHSGGFKLKSPVGTAPVTEVRIDLTGSAVFAKVGGTTMKLGTLAPISYSGSGTNADVSSNSLKLTGKAATAINGKLGLDQGLKSGEAISDAKSSTQVQAPPVSPVPLSAGPVPGSLAGDNVNTVVNTMTRNLYLGADLGPAIAAGTPEALFAAAGQILKEVEHNDFPVRAEGLADEILTEEPDLIGLQEVALWRTAPANPGVLTEGPSATTVKYDYLQELLDQLNAEGQRYEVVVVQPEFDFEVPADTGGSAAPDINGRLTMRDVILKRSNAGIETWNAEGANFDTPLPIPILGKPLPVKRGWTATDASVRGGWPFRFVNTHLEAFEAHYRAAQAAELVEPPGPATGPLPVILVGDLNSDDNTVKGADTQAFELLKVAGFFDLSTESPMSCCINDSELGEADGGNVADFDHHIDHVMTDSPEKVLLRSSAVTGLNPVNGFWDSYHAGVFSSLEVWP
jgi:endonuclease/exonuclease/phosphatase family metal-dependent hydrolase